MEERARSVAEYFDGWYAAMVDSPTKDELMQRHLGLPPRLLSTSLLPWHGIADVTDALRLAKGQTLLDLACGRGGYGLEIAARTGAQLVGIDISAEAVRQATEQAGRANRQAHFLVGDLSKTGLEPSSVHAVLCVDAIQFADRPNAAYHELNRILVPGGHVVLTSWEPVQPGDERLPTRLRHVDLAAELAAAGFHDIEVSEKTAWRALERGLWDEAASLNPKQDPALRSLHDEAVRSIETFDLLRRVVATASTPPPTR